MYRTADKQNRKNIYINHLNHNNYVFYITVFEAQNDLWMSVYE